MTYKPLYATQEDEEDKKKKGYQPLFYKEEEKAEPKPTKVSRPPIDEANTSLLVRKDVKKVGDTYQKKTDEDLKKEKEQELMQRGDKLEQSEKKDTSTTKEAVIESFNARYNLERKKQQEVNFEESIKSGKADVYGDVAKMTYRVGASALVGKVLGETNPLGIAGQMITSNLVGQQDIKEKQIIRDSRNMPIGYKEPGELGQLRDGILTGIINLESSPFFAVELIGLKTDSPRLAEWGAKMADGYKATLVAHPEWARPEDLTLVEAVKSRDIRQISKWSFRTVGELLPNMVGSMAAAVSGTLAGGPAGGAVASFGFAASQEGGSAYDFMIEDGIAQDIAAHWAGIYGAIAGVLESLSETNVINKAFRSVESKAINQIVNRSFLQNFRRNLPKYIIEYGKAQILEGSTEVAQQFTQNVIVNWLDDTQSLTEGLVESFAAGFLGSGTTFGIASTGVDIYNDAKALQTLKRLEAIAPKPPDPPGGTLAEKAEANANAKLDTLEAQERVTGVVEQPTVAEPVTDQIVPERTPAPVQNFPEVDTTTVEQFKSAVTETKEEMSKLPIAELRDRVDNIDKLEWNELSEEIKRFSWAMKDALREMIDAKKESVFVMPPVKKNNIINTIELEIVDYEDGTFGLRTATSLPTMGSASPMSGKFVSRELAIKQGVIDIFRHLEEGVRDTSNKNNVLVAQQAIKRLTAFAQSQGFTDIAPELPPEPKVAKKKQPEKKQVKTEFTGKQIGKEAKELGSDGGISDSLIKQIQVRDIWKKANPLTKAEKSATNEVYDDDKSRRSDTKRGTLPDTVRDGEERPGVDTEAIEVSSESVARGETPERRTSVGERFGSQYELNLFVEDLVKKNGTDRSKYTDDELALLKRYTGAGGIEKEGAEGRGLLDEYYTPKEVVNLLWWKIKDLIPTEAKILEPSMGIGSFVEYAPSRDYSFNGNEINPTSAAISQILYKNVEDVSTQPFEDIFIDSRGNARAYDDTVYDAIIGNPPYGKHRGVYKGLGEEVKIPEYSEYFLKRSMDLVKDDGVVAMVVPSGFLRNGPSYAKFEIAKLGSLIDAYRLPNGAFATTDIGTDIVILKKTAEGNVEQRAKEMANDTFFKENPEKILGEVSERKGRFGLEQFVKGDKENIEAEIKGAQYNAQNEQEQDWEENHADTVADLYDETTALTRELETAPKAKKAEIKEKIAEAENKMAKIEDDFIEKHTSNLENTTAEDPMNEEVAKPEPTQEKKLKKKRPDANSKVVLEPRVEGVTFQELKTEMSQEEIDTFLHSTVTGELEPSYLNSLSDEKKLELANYMNGEWYSNFNYFQGNIYDKMDALEVNKDEMTKEQYEKQKRGLEAVLPPQQVVQRMSFTPHAPFMRDTVIPYTYGEDERQETEDMTLQEAFKQFLSSLPREAFGRSSQWEIRGYIDNKVVSGGTKEQNAEERIRRREIGDRLLRKFLSEGLDEKAVKVVEDAYNRKYNATHTPDFRKVPLFGKINDVFHNDKLELLPVQRQGIGFLVNKGVGLLAHDVGVGKTMQAIVAINETMERGWSKKPLIIVPPSVYRQFTNEIIDILPHRKVNQLGSLGADFKGDLANLEIEDGSISIITYEGFKRLGFSDETYDSLMENVEDVIGDQDEKKTKRAKELEKAKISEMIGKGKRKTMTEVSFEDLGFDLVTMDEVHNANHIVAKAKPKDKEGRQSGDFRSFQIQPSDLGVKMWLASNYILKNNNGRNVYLLSATPFTNHPMEYYSILSLMGMERLRKMGLQNVNEFIQTFMDLQTQGELTVTNEYKEKTQVRGFNNYQQFVKLLTEFIDFREGEEAGVIRPERLTNNVVLNPTPEQAEQIQRVHELWENPKDEAAKKARIGLIGRLLEITFSPYASGHFYEGARPDYKQFVNGSPKIKAAMEMIKQNKKDNPDANQLIYSSVGNEFFPDIREYLIREVGFKPSEVAIIQGSTPKQKRSEIASAFNQGKIKVIIGSSAISEGMNLQKRTTDLYMLSMPWNYTDLRQIRGRIHRQGNDYKRVRIHNLFISDSVDGFLSQKLEVKEKRYEESLKFKEDYLDIGDVPFEEMKFDLVKDAVKRVRIESELTDKQLRRQLDAANGDLGMVKRKMEKLADLEERLRQERNDLDRTKDYLKDEPDDEFWQSRYQDIKKNVTSLESKIVKARAEYAEKGIDITELDKKQAVVDELESKLESLRSDMSAKLEVAEAQRAEMQTVEVAKNDYKKIADDLKAQNKTFFELTPTAKTERAKGKKLKGGSAGASVGSFKDNTPVLLGGMEHISPIALPELVDLAKELTGKVPEINSRLRTSRGKFQGSILGSEIQLRPDMFTEENQGDVAKVLAHEIGHAIDFIPDSESSRGNLIGRLKSLRKYLKGTFGEELDNKTLKNELWNMSLYWRPIEGYIEGQSNGVATDSFIKYRKSSSELYADAISMLLNSPGLLEQMAPTFYNSFFESLDAKPEAKIAFFELQELINQGAEAVNKQRLAKIYDMYNKADLKAKEIEQIKQEEKKKRKRGLFETFKQDAMTVNQPFEDRVKILKKRGENISPDMNPVYALDERNYLGGLVKARIEKDFEPIKNTIEENGMTWSDLGVLLMLERILYGDRGEVANPGGFQPEFAQEIYDDIGTVEKQADEAKQNIGSLKERLGAENFAVLQEQAKEYRSKLKQVFMEGYEAGLYSEDLKTLFDSNEFYVPFKVQEYMQQKASYSVKQKKGTLKDIENPANSGLEKVMAVLRSIEQNKAKDKSITFLKQNFAEDVVVAETRTVNGKPEALPPNKDKYPGKELVMVMEKGKPQGYYVDKYIAISLQNQTVGQTNALIKVLSFLNSRWFRPVFVCFNVGFQTFNTIRDFKRFWKNIPNMTMARAFKLYAKAIPDAYARGFNKKSAIISEMQSNKMLSVSFTDMIYETEEDAQVDIILKKLGLKENEKQTPAVLKPFSVILDFIGNVGTLVETVPKVAAYMHLTEGGMDMAEIGDLVRRKAGSPDFLAKGLYTPATNNIFLFSNAIIQGIRSDVETAVSPSTASGFWYKTSKTVFLPKMLMLAAMMGLFGVWMKEWAEGVTEYDKTNYTAIPLGIDENGKSWYLRIPEDETGRFIGAIFWKFANGLRNDQNMEKDLKDIVSLWGGQLPSVTPAITVFKDLLNFSAGANIYDSFRQRMVLSEQEQKAGGMAALKPFLTYEFNQLGGNVFVKMYSNEKNLTTTEKALRLPIVSNIIGRFIRATDYGKTESIRGISDKIQSERAKKSLGDRKLAEKYANQTPDNAMFGEKTRMEREMIMEAIGHMPITTEEKKRATSLKTRYRFYTTKQAGDVYVDQLLYAESVQEQKAILKEVKNIKSEAEFNEFKNFLRREKVVSAETLGTFER